MNAGTLIVNGSIASSAATVNAGAAAGIGTVGATTIMSGGTFAPGNSPGTMTVQGNLAFQSGALYLVQVNPSTASSANVTAGGSATLAGTVQAAFASSSYVTRTYTIVSAAGGLGGTTFNTLTTSNLPAGTRRCAELHRDRRDPQPHRHAGLRQRTRNAQRPGALGTGGLSGNQRGVAGALNNFFNRGGALPAHLRERVRPHRRQSRQYALAASGEAATGAQKVGFQMESQFLNLMLDPFVDGRSGIGGADHPRSASRPNATTRRLRSHSPMPRC